MLWLENQIGWQLHKNKIGYRIALAHPPRLDRLRPYIPVLLNVLGAVFVFLFYTGDQRFHPIFYTIPFTLILGLWFFQPALLYVNVRRRIVMSGNLSVRLSFSRVNMRIAYIKESGRYMVYVNGLETPWESLAWESTTETEAYKVFEELRRAGIAVQGPQKEGEEAELSR